MAQYLADVILLSFLCSSPDAGFISLFVPCQVRTAGNFFHSLCCPFTFPCSDRQSEKCQRQTTDGPGNFQNLAVFHTNCYFLHQQKTNGSSPRHTNLPINIRRMSTESQKACGRFVFMSYSSLSIYASLPHILISTKSPLGDRSLMN